MFYFMNKIKFYEYSLSALQLDQTLACKGGRAASAQSCLLACLEESGVTTKKTNTNQCQRGGSWSTAPGSTAELGSPGAA